MTVAAAFVAGVVVGYIAATLRHIAYDRHRHIELRITADDSQESTE